MPQLLPARILGTTRKIFAKQFSVGSFVFFLFGTKCVWGGGEGFFYFPFGVVAWDCFFLLLLYFDDLEDFFFFLLLIFAFCKFVVLCKS